MPRFPITRPCLYEARGFSRSCSFRVQPNLKISYLESKARRSMHIMLGHRDLDAGLTDIVDPTQRSLCNWCCIELSRICHLRSTRLRKVRRSTGHRLGGDCYNVLCTTQTPRCLRTDPETLTRGKHPRTTSQVTNKCSAPVKLGLVSF